MLSNITTTLCSTNLNQLAKLNQITQDYFQLQWASVFSAVSSSDWAIKCRPNSIAYLDQCQISKMELFAVIVNNLKLFMLFTTKNAWYFQVIPKFIISDQHLFPKFQTTYKICWTIQQCDGQQRVLGSKLRTRLEMQILQKVRRSMTFFIQEQFPISHQ